MADLSDVLKALSSYKFNFHTEDELQQGLAKVFDLESIEYTREYILDGNSRIDFYFPSLKSGIEVKTGGSAPQLGRQVRRYLDYEALDSIIVLVTKRRLVNLPSSLNGKNIYVKFVGNL